MENKNLDNNSTFKDDSPATIFTIVGYGIWKTRGSQDIHGYLLGGNEAKWWTVGLSVMATQASAITFLSTPGQAYIDGMGKD